MQIALEGQVSDFIISDNINYYRNYIENEISNGKNEEEVLNMLGDPRLLSKTIIEMHSTDDNTNNANSEYSKNNYDKNNQEDENNTNNFQNPKYHSFMGIKGCLITIIVLFVLFVILKFVLSIAIYFAIPICLILLIVGIYRRLRN